MKLIYLNWYDSKDNMCHNFESDKSIININTAVFLQIGVPKYGKISESKTEQKYI